MASEEVFNDREATSGRKPGDPERKTDNPDGKSIFDRPPANSNGSPDLEALRNAGTQRTQNPARSDVGWGDEVLLDRETIEQLVRQLITTLRQIARRVIEA